MTEREEIFWMEFFGAVQEVVGADAFREVLTRLADLYADELPADHPALRLADEE